MLSNSFLALSAETFRSRTFLSLGKGPVWIIFMIKRGITVLLNDSCQTVPKILVGEPFWVSKNYGVEKFHAYERWRYHDLPSNLLCLTVSKHFVQQPFCVSQKFWFWIFLRKKGYHVSFLNKLRRTMPKRFIDEPFSISQKLRFQKLFRIRKGLSRYSVEYFCFTVLKHFIEEPLCFRKFLVPKSFFSMRAVITIFPKSFCLTVLKLFVEEPFCVSDIFLFQFFLLITISSKISCLTVPERSVNKPYSVSESFRYGKKCR